MTKLLTVFCLITSCALHAQQINYTWDGGNGSNGLGDYGIVTRANTGQATLGAEGNGDLYANLGLGTNISGTRRFWLISKRTSLENHGLHFYFYDGTSFKAPTLALASNGFVGIGTALPYHRLEIAETSGSASLGIKGKLDSKIIFEPSDGSDRFTIWANMDYVTANDLLRFGAGQAPDILALKGDGNVGIGTITPDAKLTVKGDIHTSEVRVDLTGALQGPDYVFEKDYNLLPLSEIEAYINENKHLPEVPSAKEMETNGLNLKEMNLLLLKKVEELTLHLIEQNKDIQALKSDNAALKKEQKENTEKIKQLLRNK